MLFYNYTMLKIRLPTNELLINIYDLMNDIFKTIMENFLFK